MNEDKLKFFLLEEDESDKKEDNKKEKLKDNKDKVIIDKQVITESGKLLLKD